MKSFILLLAIFLTINAAYAKNPIKKSEKPVLTSPVSSQVPIDEEFQTGFVGFDEKEFKQYQKEQEKQARLNQKRAKLEEKKVKLELKRKISRENQERCQIYLEKLQTSEVAERTFEENL